MLSTLPESRKEIAIKMLKDIVREIRQATVQKPETLGYKHPTVEAEKFDTVQAQEILSAFHQLTHDADAKEAE